MKMGKGNAKMTLGCNCKGVVHSVDCPLNPYQEPESLSVVNSHEDLVATLRWIIERLERESDESILNGQRANWRKAAFECVEEAYGALGRLEDKGE